MQNEGGIESSSATLDLTGKKRKIHRCRNHEIKNNLEPDLFHDYFDLFLSGRKSQFARVKELEPFKARLFNIARDGVESRSFQNDLWLRFKLDFRGGLDSFAHMSIFHSRHRESVRHDSRIFEIKRKHKLWSNAFYYSCSFHRAH